MKRKRSSTTNFQRWHRDHGTPHVELAAALGCTAGSVRHYLMGTAVPRPDVLRKLTALTGLPSDAFLFPFEPYDKETV